MTPGTHPAKVSRKTISTDPHPRSMTARGGKRIANKTLINDIGVDFKNNRKSTKIRSSLPTFWQDYIFHAMRLREQWRNFLVCESGYATADAGNEEGKFGVILRKGDKLIHIRADGLHTTLHRGDGVTLPLQTDTLSHNSAKIAVGDACRPTAVHALQVAAEDKNLVRLQFGDKLRCGSFLFHIHFILFFATFQLFQCAAELVGAGGGLPSAADAVEFWDDVVDFLAGDQPTDALEVSVASAIKEDLLDDAVVIDGHIDELRTGALGFVEGVFHVRGGFY